MQGTRTWRQRLEKVDTNWNTILEQLTDAYLTWRYPPADSSPPTMNAPKCPLNVRSPPPSTARPPATNPESTAGPVPHQPDRLYEQPDQHTPLRAEGGGPAHCANDTPTDVPPLPDGSRERPEQYAFHRAEGLGSVHDAADPPSSGHPAHYDPVSFLERPAAVLNPPPQEAHPSAASAACGTPAQARDDTYDFDIDIVDMYSLARTAAIQRKATDTTVIAMAEQGYLATTPISPSLAITFNTLEHFRLLRLRKPSFSIEAFAKVLCDSYAVCLPLYISNLCYVVIHDI